MIKVENRQWERVEHSPLATTYLGQIIVHSLRGDTLSDDAQSIAATCLIESCSGLQSVTIQMDEFLPRMFLSLRMESDCQREAFAKMCSSAIDAWKWSGNGSDDLELVEACLVSEPTLLSDMDEDEGESLAYTSARYQVERVELEELDVFGEIQMVEARQFFDMMLETI